ncbi:PREDICTED: uncharacterized protein LOC109377723 isoform X2 [Hipposideros armiger]|uniref:Uncharacterized protein LOC109377723 isoform X2 n=1 Tax=Hipposideros armiger TaxID=186990 RepID=A0A8B7QPS0_HIPAR|nr:PREDICTED: uncharacterized protein LOC109377723 isoform X2 [Hipposideros armiger]
MNPTFLCFFAENLKSELPEAGSPESGEPQAQFRRKPRVPAREEPFPPELGAEGGQRPSRTCAPVPDPQHWAGVFRVESQPRLPQELFLAAPPCPSLQRGRRWLALAARRLRPVSPRRRWLLVSSTRAGPGTEHVWKRSAASAAAGAELGCVRLSPFTARPQERSASAAPLSPAERGALAVAGPSAAHRSPLLATRKVTFFARPMILLSNLSLAPRARQTRCQSCPPIPRGEEASVPPLPEGILAQDGKKHLHTGWKTGGMRGEERELSPSPRLLRLHPACCVVLGAIF